MRRFLSIGAWLLLCAAVFASCANQGTAVTLPTPTSYGSGLKQFTLAFPDTPTMTSSSADYGRWDSREVTAAVAVRSAPVRPGRMEAVLRSMLPFATGGRMFLLAGHPAIREVVDCSTPSGPCSGKVGGLEVLDGLTFYSGFTSGLDEISTLAVMASLKVPQLASGCRFSVSARGFLGACTSSSA